MQNLQNIELSPSVKNLLNNFESPLMVTHNNLIIFFNNELLSFLNTNAQRLKNNMFSNIFSIDNNSQLEGHNTVTTDHSTIEYKHIYLNYNKSNGISQKCLSDFKVFKDGDNTFNLIKFYELTNENLLKIENAELKKQNLLKTSFLANMSHEIRTPLNSIIGFSELLQDEDTTKDEEKLYKKLISSSGKSLMQLIEDIIDISKIESQQLKITKAKFELNAFLDELLASFKQEKQIRELYNISISLSKGCSKDELFIFTDQTRLRQVLSNLIINSLKFTDSGFIKFGYLITPNKQLQFYVKDSGTGINKEARSEIFERFGQDSSTLNRNKEGSGLGLSISKSIIKLLDGEIWMDTETGYGTTFYFTIPVNNPDSTNSIFPSNDEVYIPDYRNKTILIVDDIEPNIFFLKSLFELTNAKIILARTGKEAIEKCKEDSSVSIVLMDIMMPELDGYDATLAIKKLLPDLPIIMQTAFSSTTTQEKSFAVGADDFLSKPINPQVLFEHIDKYLKV